MKMTQQVMPATFHPPFSHPYQYPYNNPTDNQTFHYDNGDYN